MIKWIKTHQHPQITKKLVQRVVKNDSKRFGYSQPMLVWWRFVPKRGYKEPAFEPRMAIMNFVNGEFIIEGVTGEVEVSHFSPINDPQ